MITFSSYILDNADSEDKKPFESGDGTAATTIAGDLDDLEKDNEVDMVVEIKASDKILTDEKYYEEMKAEHREALEANLPTIESFYNKLQCTVCSKNVDPVIGELNNFISSSNIKNRQTLNVYLLFAIWMGQIQSKLIYIFVTNEYGLASF